MDGTSSPYAVTYTWTSLAWRLAMEFFQVDQELYFPPHSHDEYSIWFCVQGSIEIIQEGIAERLGPGQAFIGNSGATHAARYGAGASGASTVNVAVASDFLRDYLRHVQPDLAARVHKPAFGTVVDLQSLTPLAGRVADELRAARAGRSLLLDQMARQIVLETLREFPSDAVRPLKEEGDRRLPGWEWVRAAQYMYACGKTAFSVREMSSRSGGGYSRFVRLFRNSTGFSPTQFYNRLLTGRAARMLVETDRSIKEIALYLGFSSSSHFCNLFRTVSSLSPTEYRERRAYLTGPSQQERLFSPVR